MQQMKQIGNPDAVLSASVRLATGIFLGTLQHAMP